MKNFGKVVIFLTLAAGRLYGVTPVSKYDKITALVSKDQLKKDFPTVCRDLDLRCAVPDSSDVQLSITETRQIETPSLDKIIIGNMKAPSLKREYSFVGIYFAKLNSFGFLAFSSASKLNVRVGKLIQTEPSFIFVDPVSEEDDDARKLLIIFRFSPKLKNYQKTAKVTLFATTMGDDPGNSFFHFIDTSKFKISPLPQDLRKEIIVETSRKDISSAGDLEFSKRIETYGWFQDHLCVVERIDDGKKIFGRADPMCEIEYARDQNESPTWIRLLDLVRHSNTTVSKSAYEMISEKQSVLAREKKKFSSGFVDALITSYPKASDNQRILLSAILYGKATSMRDPTLTEKNRKILEQTIRPKAPNDINLLNVLAYSDDLIAWKPLIQMLSYSLGKNNGCDASNVITGLNHLKEKTKMTAEDVNLFKKVYRSKLSCGPSIISEEVEQFISKGPVR
jgi:hypothetical protein